MAGNNRNITTSRRGILVGAPLAAVAASVPAAAAEAFWTARYQAHKGDVTLAMYRKRLHAPHPGEPKLPVLFLVHGSSISALPSFDLTVPGAGEYSLMNVFARYGFDVWTMDFEGYGKSTVTSGNSDIASGVADLRAAVPVVERETGQSKFHFMGESSGAIRAAAFAVAEPARVQSLVLEAFTYTGKGSPTLAKRGEQTAFYRTHNRRPRGEDMIKSIFTRDKPGTSDPRVPAAIAKAEMPNGDSVPTGTYLDMTANLPLVDPTKVQCPVLMVRGQYDGISTEEDLLDFFTKLPTPDKQYAVIPGAAHAVGMSLTRADLWHVMHEFLTMPKTVERARDMGFLSDEERAQLLPAEDVPHRFPIPTQIVSSDEYFPEAQTAEQKQVEARLTEMADHLARRQGVSRRRFFQTASGMAAAFLAMNQVYGKLFAVTEAEAATPEMADERAVSLRGQDVFDVHTHFLRDDTRLTNFVAMRAAVGKSGWNKELGGRQQTIADLKFDNYFKEVFLDSDTKVALLTNSPSDIPEDWFLTNEMVFQTRDKVNKQAGSRRLLAHYTIVPGQPGWLEGIDHAIATLHPDGWKGYTVGDNTHKETSHYPWRLDDETLMYPAYERFVSSGVKNVCIHKGLFPPSTERRVPNLRGYADVSDVGRAAKDWPGLNFVIYHSAYRHVGGSPADAMAEWDRTGRSSWVSDLADIPAEYGVTNVYGDLGQLFAYTSVAEPRLAAALMGTLVKGLGADHVIWGTDAVWTGAPQWQIEGLRRLEIPDDMQRKHGFAPLGAADGPVKRGIFANNGFRLFGYDRHAELATPDRFAAIKEDYLRNGADPSNLRYGYVRRA